MFSRVTTWLFTSRRRSNGGGLQQRLGRTDSTRTLRLVLIIALAGCGGPSAGTPSFAPAPHAVGHASPKAVRKTSSQATDWDSFGFDIERSGYNPNETSVGTSNVGSLQKLWSTTVGYEMVHEPVFAQGVTVNSQATNVLYAGSADGATMYAINASDGSVLWKDPVPYFTYRCVKKARFSIGETPAIDRAKNLLYFSDGHNQVHAVDLATGAEASGWPVSVANYSREHNFMHGGLTYNPANGLLYAVTGSHTCDISPWYGRIVAIDTTGPSIAGKFFTMSGTSKEGPSGGGIWGPGGASIDPSTNNVFIATGNADTHNGAQQNSAYAEQIVELSPTLGTIVANNYPPNIPIISGENDFDFGATPLLFQPSGCPLLLAAINKSGMFELYDVSSISYGPVQYIAMAPPSDMGNFVGVPAYDPVTGYVYVGIPSSGAGYQPGLAAFSMQSNCTLNPTAVWNAAFGPDGTHSPKAQTPRSPISIANGVVYVANYSRNTEFAFDAATGSELWKDLLPGFGDVGTVIADGVVYVSARGGNITAWAPPGGKKKRSPHARVPIGSSALGPRAAAAAAELDRVVDY